MVHKLKPRIDRFINIMEKSFNVDNINLLREIYGLLKQEGIAFWEFIKPYLDVSIKNPDLFTRTILLNNYLVIRLSYDDKKDKITGNYTKTDLKLLLEDFKQIVEDLEKRIGE